jgi:AmmeMemoRadiSam system protein B/AmmeMemoRadiSam system protein A
MTKIREAAFAGSFYDSDEIILRETISSFFAKAKENRRSHYSKIVLAPHAGYVFSGQIAADAINQLDKEKIKRVFIIASAHYYLFKGVSIDTSDFYSTPLGKIPVDTKIANELIKNHNIISHIPNAHKKEHCIEVQIPLLQYHLENFQIVPIIIGSYDTETPKQLAKALNKYLNDKENAFVISTDFSHYPNYTDAIRVDNETSNAIISGNPSELLEIIEKHKKVYVPKLETDLCGWTSVLTALYLTETKKYIWKIISSANSGDSVYGENDRVVGYTSIKAYQINVKDFKLSNSEKEFLLKYARKTITHKFKPAGIDFPKNADIPENLTKDCGAFVSLHKNDGQLRGCVGRFSESTSLIKIVKEMSSAAAFDDTRFSPLHFEELNDINIEISVLTPLKKIKDYSEIELNRHGIYIKKNQNSGTFLPQVATDTNWTIEEFLGHCSRDKAGIGWDGWKTADLYTYEAIIFSEK